VLIPEIVTVLTPTLLPTMKSPVLLLLESIILTLFPATNPCPVAVTIPVAVSAVNAMDLPTT